MQKSAVHCCPHCAGESRRLDDAGNGTNKTLKFWRLCFGAALFAGGMVFEFSGAVFPSPAIRPAVFISAWILIGGDVLFAALRNLVRGRVFDENFLMSIATIGAFAIGEYPEGAAVMLFYRIGETIEGMAVKRSRRSISALMDIRPDYANLKTGDEIVKVNPADVRAGALVVVKPGEKIPLDGIVVEGSSALDTSALSGEALPRDVETGDEVFSGSINMNGLLLVSVTKEYGESTVSKILELVENAGNRKAAVENFITSFARCYTPVVVFSAFALALLPPLFIEGALFSEWLNRALVFLVVSCPCALVVSVPLSFFGGIGAASRQGILVKGSNYISALNTVDTVVFDKTGTLTRGVFSVREIHPENGTAGREELLYYAAAAESNSNHPIASSIVKAYGKPIAVSAVESHEEKAGRGIRALVNGRTVLAGNARFLEESGVPFTVRETPGTIVYIALDGVYSGCLVIADELKRDSRRAVAGLRKAGVRRIVMLSGDNRASADKAGAEAGVDEVYAELLPHQKLERVEILQKEIPRGKKLLFAGDGVNDAPALARSDIGAAMGGLGSDAAIEAADLVLLTDEPFKLVSAMDIAGRTGAIVRQNIVFSLGVKVLILALGAFGAVGLWAAVFGDVGVTLIAVLNALRILTVKADSAEFPGNRTLKNRAKLAV